MVSIIEDAIEQCTSSVRSNKQQCHNFGREVVVYRLYYTPACLVSSLHGISALIGDLARLPQFMAKGLSHKG